MKLLPYFSTTDSNWIILNIFLSEGGRSTWEIDDTETDVKSMLSENGFPLVNMNKMGDTIYAEIDGSTIKMSDFYMWTEVDPKISENDVWRRLTIPVALWSCPVFKENFWKSAGLPFTFAVEV